MHSMLPLFFVFLFSSVDCEMAWARQTLLPVSNMLQLATHTAPLQEPMFRHG